MIRRGWMYTHGGWLLRVLWTNERDGTVPAVALPAADFDRLLALLEECAGDLEEVAGTRENQYASDPDNDMDLPRRVRALLKEVGDGEG